MHPSFLNDTQVTLINKTQASHPAKRENIFGWEPLNIEPLCLNVQ